MSGVLESGHCHDALPCSADDGQFARGREAGVYSRDWLDAYADVGGSRDIVATKRFGCSTCQAGAYASGRDAPEY